jgi:hypothetical protein
MVMPFSLGLKLSMFLNVALAIGIKTSPATALKNSPLIFDGMNQKLWLKKWLH